MVNTVGLSACVGWALVAGLWPTPLTAFPPVRADACRAAPRGLTDIYCPVAYRAPCRAGQPAPPTPAIGGLFAQSQQPLLRRLPPQDRARVLAALAGLVILGFALVLLAWWGGRYTRRYLRRPWPGSERRDTRRVSEFDWASKPMYPKLDSEEDAGGEPRD